MPLRRTLSRSTIALLVLTASAFPSARGDNGTSLRGTVESSGTGLAAYNDGQLDSALFTTQASIGVSGGGQQNEVDEFLAYVSPVENSIDLPAGTTSVSVVIIYGPTILPSTFQASLNGVLFGGFHPSAGTSETVTIPLASGRNVLALQVIGV